MAKSGSSSKESWAPSACTLPTTEQPLRQQQFDELFADAVIAVDRIDAATVRLTLRPEAQLAVRAAELSSHETDCCSFFTFALTFNEGALWLDISVPPAQEPVLEALTERAQTISAGAA